MQVEIMNLKTEATNSLEMSSKECAGCGKKITER